MIDWFLSLEEATQATLISGIISSVVVGLIAVLGFWLTFKTSTAANREIANVTQSTKLEELHLQRKIRVSEFREKRISEIRECIAEYLSLMSDISASSKQDEINEKYSRVSLLSFKIQLMLDMGNEENQKLVSTLYDHFEDAMKRKKADEDMEQAVLVLTRSILVRDWNKLIIEIETNPTQHPQ